MKKTIVLLLVGLFCFSVLTGCIETRTREELIQEVGLAGENNLVSIGRVSFLPGDVHGIVFLGFGTTYSDDAVNAIPVSFNVQGEPIDTAIPIGKIVPVFKDIENPTIEYVYSAAYLDQVIVPDAAKWASTSREVSTYVDVNVYEYVVITLSEDVYEEIFAYP